MGIRKGILAAADRRRYVLESLESMLPRKVFLSVRLLVCGGWVLCLYLGLRFAPDAVMTDHSTTAAATASFPLADVPHAGPALDCPLCRACPSCPPLPLASPTAASADMVIRERKS